MLFIDAEGTPQQLAKASEELSDIGYLQCDEDNRSVMLLEFRLKDEPGSVTSILELISAHNFNISQNNCFHRRSEKALQYQSYRI